MPLSRELPVCGVGEFSEVLSRSGEEEFVYLRRSIREGVGGRDGKTSSPPSPALAER